MLRTLHFPFKIFFVLFLVFKYILETYLNNLLFKTHLISDSITDELSSKAESYEQVTSMQGEPASNETGRSEEL